MSKDSVIKPVPSPLIIRAPVPPGFYGYEPDTAQVSQYIRRIFQDSKGNLWFGTVGDGVCRYDGTSLTYFTTLDGFSGNNVQGIVEDQDGNLWFGTTGGISRYDGTHFTHFTEKQGLPHKHVMSLCIDQSGTLWAGTLEGVCRYNARLNDAVGQGKSFTPFPLPAPVVSDVSHGKRPKEVKSIITDQAGNLWFGTNGGGVFRYDGKSLTNLSEHDGLINNVVNWMLQDRMGNLWFATQHRGAQIGLSRYDARLNDVVGQGQAFTNFTAQESPGGGEVWAMLEDRGGNIWLSSRDRVSRFDGNAFTAFTAADGLTNCCVQSIYEDRSGNLWVGSGAGLFRFDARLNDVVGQGQSFINVTKQGPWPQRFR